MIFKANITEIDAEPTPVYAYVWVDEDNAQVSPIHAKFGSALNFYEGWHERWAKIIEKHGPPTSDQLKSVVYSKAYTPMTRSGKPPVALKRLVARFSLEDLIPDEASVVGAIVRLNTQETT